MLPANERWAIHETLNRQSHLFDNGQIHQLLEVFASDIVYDMSAAGLGVFEGIAAVLNTARGMAKAEFGPYTHHVTNIVILEADDDEASVESKVFMLMKDGSTQSALQRDTLRRQEDGWRISRRVISPMRAHG